MNTLYTDRKIAAESLAKRLIFGAEIEMAGVKLDPPERYRKTLRSLSVYFEALLSLSNGSLFTIKKDRRERVLRPLTRNQKATKWLEYDLRP